MIHVLLHFAVPASVAVIWKERYVRAALMLLAALIIDLDHLLANPIYDPHRCSVGFHPLHAIELIPVYGALTFFRRTRLFGLGLLIHIALDGVDCVWMMAER